MLEVNSARRRFLIIMPTNNYASGCSLKIITYVYKFGDGDVIYLVYSKLND